MTLTTYRLGIGYCAAVYEDVWRPLRSWYNNYIASSERMNYSPIIRSTSTSPSAAAERTQSLSATIGCRPMCLLCKTYFFQKSKIRLTSFHQPHPIMTLILLLSPLVQVILHISPYHSPYLRSVHLSLSLPFTPDLELVSFTHPSLRGLSCSIWTCLHGSWTWTGLTGHWRLFALLFLYFIYFCFGYVW